MKDFLTDEEMQKLEANETPDFISDEEMAKIEGPKVEPVTMVENEPTPIADMMVGLNRGIESAGDAITSPIRKLFTAPPNQDVVVPEELDLGSMQAVRDRQAMLPPSMPAEPGYVPPAGITDALRVAPGLALDATGQMISGAIQQAQEVTPSMINRAYERFANADLGGVLPPQMQQKVAPIINIPQEDIDTIAAVGQQAEENIKARLQEARIQPGLNAPNIVANAASSIIQQAPLFAGTALGGPVVGAAGLAAMGIGSMGARYQKARASGYKPEEAMLESGLYGLAEIIPEKLGMDAIFAAAKNPYAAKSLVEGIKRLMVAIGLSMTAEGLEETATQLAQNTIRKYARPDSERITEKPVESIVEGVPEAAVTGAVGGGAIGGSMNLINQIANRNNIEPEEPTATEPPPQNMEATTEFLTRKPAVTFGEAERLRGEEVPTGGMTIESKRKPTVIFGGEGERTGEAIPEGRGMTIQPTAPTNRLDQLFKREVKPKQIENRFDFSQETDINKLRSMLDDAVERENFQPGAESDAILKRIDELENQAIDQVSPELLRRIQDNGVSTEASQRILEKAFLIKKDSIINNPKRMDALLNEYSGIESVVKKTAKIILEDYVKQNFPKADVDGLFSNASPLSREAQTKIIKDAQAKAKAIHGSVKDYFENPVEERMEQPSKTSPQPQQATEVAPKGIDAQPVSETPVKPLEVIEKEIEDLKFKLNRNRNISAKQLMEAKTNISIFQDDIGDALRKNKDTSFASKQWEEIKSKYSPETLEEAEKQKFAVKEEEKMAINRKIAAEYQRKIDEQKLQPAEPTAVKTPEIKEPWQMTKEEYFQNKMEEKGWTKGAQGEYWGMFNERPLEWKPKDENYKTQFRSESAKHEKEIKKAFYEGKPVPPEVLAEYPDLKVEQKAETKPQTYTDKSVKDLPQKVILNNGVIEIGHTQPKKYKGPSRYTITVEEFERAKKSSGNPEYGIRQLIKKKWFDLTKPTLEEEAVAERIVDSQIYAIKKVLEQEPRPKSGPGMFGGATVQNMYEEVAPTLKKGADMLFKKGKQAYETVKRNADLTRDMGRVVDITEKEGRPVETEPPIRPRIGLFNLQNVYDALTRPMKRRAEDKRFKEHLDKTMAVGPRQRIEEARGIDKLSFMDKARKAITRAKELATRKFPDLDEKQFPEFANKLRVLDGGKDYADGTAGYIVGETIKDLSPEEYNVFGTNLILDDLQKGLDTGLYTNDLPFGYDAQSLAADRQAINPAELRKAGFNEKADRIEEAIRKRNDFMREVKQEAVDNGLLPEAVMNDDRYFHHQVLQYMNMQDEAKSGVKKDVRLGKKGYRMSRTGSLLDFNSEYAQAEFEVLSQMIEDNKRAEFLKYVESLDITPNLRAQAQAQGLPTDAKTLKQLRPEGYVEWQPAKGNNFYKVFTIPERIVEEIITKGDAVDVSMDDINEALAVGGPKKTLVIPEGLVKTLDNFKTPRNDGALGKLGNAINKIWKTSMLFMPSRVTNYMVTNAFGDTDVVLAYQPKILGELPSAIKELKTNDRKNNKDLEKAYKEQVIGANITEKEIQNIDYESINKPFNIMRYLKNPLNIGKDYLQRAVRINAFRENALRYAAYKYFLSELRAGKKNIYAASDRTKIDGITDMEEKAATLARDLMGDYGNVSALGEEIARKIIPFYRWMEVNTPRYYRLLKNASNEGGYEGAIKGGYKTLKRFVQMNIVGTILYQLYHAAIGAISGDDELEKARDVTRARGQLHSLLPNWLIGDDKKDIVRTVRTQGAWSDATETLIGTSDLFSDFMDVATGKTKFKDKMKELGWKLDNPADFFNIPPIRKYSMAALPLARTAAETITGRASTRSLMETRPIRDRMQHFARAMALGAPYNIATDKPGPERGISDLVTYKTNLGEVAYNEITRKKYEFLRERGYPLPSASESPSGTAYYNLKQAVKFGDKKQIRKYFKEYNQERRKLGKDAADWYDVKERIKESADPSSFMKEELWDEFRKTLNNEEKRKLKTAMRWFKETYK